MPRRTKQAQIEELEHRLSMYMIKFYISIEIIILLAAQLLIG